MRMQCGKMVLQFVMNIMKGPTRIDQRRTERLSAEHSRGVRLGLRLSKLVELELILLFLRLLLKELGPRVVDAAGGSRLLTLRLGEDTSGDEDTDGEALGPHTGLHNLLGRRLIAVLGWVSSLLSLKRCGHRQRTGYA